MRIDSCRKCGNEMKPSDEYCNVCDSPMKFVCTECKKETDMQYHVQFHKNDHSQEPIPVLKTR